MRRIWLVAAVLVLAAGAAAIYALVRGGGSGNETVATVGRQRVTREQLDLTVDHFHEEADREGRPFPARGTAAFRAVERQSLQLLLYRARLELAAGRIGVRVSREEVERHVPPPAAGGGDEEGPTIRAKAEAAFVRGTVRTQLLTQKVFERVTEGVHVPPAAVRAYYRSHRAIYGRAPFRQLAVSIRRQLVAARRNAVMERWLAKTRRIAADVRDDALKD
jgi:hypothetical protein